MILITGGAGYIGSHLTLALVKAGIDVIVYDNLISSTPTNLKKINALSNRTSLLYFVKGDVRDPVKLEQIFKRFNITKAIHLAGLKSVPQSFIDTSEYKSVNEIGGEVVFNMALKYSVQTLIFSSTAAVYTPTNRGIYVESDVANGFTSPHARSKLVSERHLINIKEQDKSIDIVILRYFNPVGLDKSGLLIEEGDFSGNLFPVILNAIKTKDYVKIYGKGYVTVDGTAVRDYIHISDVVDVHLKLMQQKVLSTEARIFNIGSTTGYSVKQVIDTFNTQLKESVKFYYADAREGDTGRCVADTTKIFNEIQWTVKHDLVDMVQSVIPSDMRL